MALGICALESACILAQPSDTRLQVCVYASSDFALSRWRRRGYDYLVVSAIDLCGRSRRKFKFPTKSSEHVIKVCLSSGQNSRRKEVAR
jgi:hypothetical protein